MNIHPIILPINIELEYARTVRPGTSVPLPGVRTTVRVIVPANVAVASMAVATGRYVSTLARSFSSDDFSGDSLGAADRPSRPILSPILGCCACDSCGVVSALAASSPTQRSRTSSMRGGASGSKGLGQLSEIFQLQHE
jgi:hypothetical protein